MALAFVIGETCSSSRFVCYVHLTAETLEMLCIHLFTANLWVDFKTRITKLLLPQKYGINNLQNVDMS